jgi:hypothetical protein
MTKSDIYWRFEKWLQFYHFCVARNIKYLELIFRMFGGYIIDYVWIFFLLEFSKTQNIIYFKKKNTQISKNGHSLATND